MMIISWAASILALLGVWLNIHKNALCFPLWAVSNATWVWVDLCHGIYSQAALQTVYFFLSLYGIWMWRVKDRS